MSIFCKPKGRNVEDDFLGFLAMAYGELAHVKDSHIVAIGDDAFGNTIQIYAWLMQVVDPRAEVELWAERSQRKIAKYAWVGVKISGHDADGDWRSFRREYHKQEAPAAIDALLNLARLPGSGDRLLHKGITQ